MGRFSDTFIRARSWSSLGVLLVFSYKCGSLLGADQEKTKTWVGGDREETPFNVLLPGPSGPGT